MTVDDEGGSQVVMPGTTVVTDLPVTGATKSFTAVEGQNFGPFVLATFTDPNTLATVADVQATLADRRLGRRRVRRALAAGPSNSSSQRRRRSGRPETRPSRSSAATPTPTPRRQPRAQPDPSASFIHDSVAATMTQPPPGDGGVAVLDSSLTGLAGTEITGVEGNSTGTALLGTFVDANQAATVADFTSGGGSVVVNWGDGSALQTLPAGRPRHHQHPRGRRLDHRRRPHPTPRRGPTLTRSR